MNGRILTCVYCGHEYPQDTPAAGSQVLTEHIRVCEKHPIRKAEGDTATLRAALVGLIGADTEQELREMEATMRLLPAPEADKAVSINAIHALLATLPPNAIVSGFCRHGAAVMSNKDLIEQLCQQLADMTAERDELREQLAAFHSAVEHVTENGCTRRSVVAMPEGWATVHKDRLHGLELAEEQLSEREKQAVLLRDALDDLASCMQGVIEGDYTPDSFTLQPANTALAATDGLSGYILCEKEPVVWMQSDHLSKFIHHACGAQAALVRCSDHQLMPDFQPLYCAKEPKPRLHSAARN